MLQYILVRQIIFCSVGVHFLVLNYLFCYVEDNEPYLKVNCSESKITSAVWGPLGENVIAGHENGELNLYSAKVRQMLFSSEESDFV